MTPTVKQQERRVDLEIAMLRPLTPGGPDPALKAELRRIVVQEGRRLRADALPARLARWSLGAAAALALAAGFARTPVPQRPAENPFESFDRWARAFEDSGTMIEFGFAGHEEPADPERALDEWLQGLESTAPMGS